MKLIIFYQNSEIIGIFSDYDEFKKKSFYHILDSLVSKNIYKNRVTAGKNIKNMLKEFYKQGKEINIKDFLWKREKMEENIIHKDIEIKKDHKELVIIKTNIKITMQIYLYLKILIYLKN